MPDDLDILVMSAEHIQGTGIKRELIWVLENEWSLKEWNSPLSVPPSSFVAQLVA